MNILHVKYAVEIAKTGSISKASETLLVAQPNLSRSIKALESDLNIKIFERSSKGMFLTPAGAEFIDQASELLGGLDSLEEQFHSSRRHPQIFSVSVPRASYISDAFLRFSAQLGTHPASILYKETNSMDAIRNICDHDFKLGIIRFAADYEEQFDQYLEEKGLKKAEISSFYYRLIFNRDGVFSKKEQISSEDLASGIQLVLPDCRVPSVPYPIVRSRREFNSSPRRIFIFERGSQMETLSHNPEAFMWVSPIPENLLERYNLLQKDCSDFTVYYKDALIYRNNYSLTPIDQQFLDLVASSRQEAFSAATA